MGILKNIWNTLFGKTTQESKFEKEDLIGKAKMDVVHNKNAKGKVGAYNTKDTKFTPNNSCQYQEPVKTFCELYPNASNVCNPPIVLDSNKPLVDNANVDDFFVSNDLIAKENKMDSEVANLTKKVKVNNVIGKKTLVEIKDYLIKYGSIDVLTCEQIFKVKSLHNFIWQLRKEGLKIKTDKVGLHNELGQKIEVTNYRLISKK